MEIYNDKIKNNIDYLKNNSEENQFTTNPKQCSIDHIIIQD